MSPPLVLSDNPHNPVVRRFVQGPGYLLGTSHVTGWSCHPEIWNELARGTM